MKETRLKRLIKKMMDCVFLDAMTPEFKAANAELLKAIKMNDKSGAIPHVDLEAINKAFKANDAEKAGQALKKVQLQLSKAEKALDDEVKDVNARLADAKQAGEKTKQELKAKKALEAVFEKAKSVCDSVKSNPKNASKLTALTDKLRDYGDLSKRASHIVTLSASGKDVSKQVDMLRKSIDTAEKKYKKDLANIEKEAKKAKDALEVMAMRQKVTQGKRDAFQKERLYLAKVIKELGEGVLPMDVPERKEKAFQENKEKREKVEKELKDYIYKIGEAGALAKQQVESKISEMRKNKTLAAYADEKLKGLVHEARMKYREIVGDDNVNKDMMDDLDSIYTLARRGYSYEAKTKMENLGNNDKLLKKLFVKPLNFIKKMYKERDSLYQGNYNGFGYNTANECYSKRPLYSAATIIAFEPEVKSKVEMLLKQMDGISIENFLRNLRSNYFRPYI